MFDPTIGQFVNEDPSGFDPGDPNLRRFVGNDPTNATDPSGLDGLPILMTGRLSELPSAVTGLFDSYNKKVRENLAENYRKENRLGRPILRVLDDDSLQVGFRLETEQWVAAPELRRWYHTPTMRVEKRQFVETQDIAWAAVRPFPDGVAEARDRMRLQWQSTLDSIPFARTVEERRLGSRMDVAAANDARQNAEFVYDSLVPVGGRLTREGILDGTVSADGVFEAITQGLTLYAGVELMQPGRAPGGTVLASAAEGYQESLLPLSSLSKRQLAVHEMLPEAGATTRIVKRQVSMTDLRAIGQVTGDEYTMFTLGGRRFVIRGCGNELRVTEEMASDLMAGRYGRWSGHTHPPGYSIEPSIIDRSRIPIGQSRSAVWGDEGFRVFYRTPADDMIFEAGQRAELMRRFYEQQQ